MDRQKVIDFLDEQLKELKEKNVAELMKKKRVEELEKIAETLDYSLIEQLIEVEDGLLELEYDEIPKDYLYELAFYINQSEFSDSIFFDDWEDFKELLADKQEALAYRIVDLMLQDDLRECKLEELLQEQ